MDEMLFWTLQGFSFLLFPALTHLYWWELSLQTLSFPRTDLEKRWFPLHSFNIDLGADENGRLGVLCEPMKLQPNVFTLSLVIWYLALAIPPALELGMENMRALFRSKGLETGGEKKKKKDISGLLANGICFTLDFNTWQEQLM